MRRRLLPLRRFVRPMQRATDVLATIAALPMADMDAIAGNRPILILAPHPDDESLGCGGLIAQACAAGHQVHVAILTDGAYSHPNSPSYPAARLKALRQAEAAEAVSVLGLPSENLLFLDYEDGNAPQSGAPLRAAAERLAGIMRSRDVGCVFASWEHDPHPDHLAAHRIAAMASQLAAARHRCYAVWGWTLSSRTWLPPCSPAGYRLDVEAMLPVKRRAIACHRSQMTSMINDDPGGFKVPAVLLEACDRTFEAYFEPAASAQDR